MSAAKAEAEPLVEDVYDDKMICPFCREEISDSWEYGGDSGEIECPSCENKFGFERSYDVNHRTFVKKKEETHKERTERERRELPPEERSFEAGPPKALARTGEVSIHDTKLMLSDEHCQDKPMAAVFKGVLAVLHRRGFRLERDPDTLKHYPLLADSSWYGARGELEVQAELRGRSIETTFFQSINVEHKAGGYYDYDRWKRMPRAMLLACIADMNVLIERYFEHGYELSPRNGGFSRPLALPLLVRDAILGWKTSDPAAHCKESGWAHTKRDEHGFRTKEEYKSWSFRDRDGIELCSRDTRYFYRYGHLVRGTVYPANNGQWFALAGGEISYHQANEYFSSPDGASRRYVRGQKKRLDRELEKALKKKDYARVVVLAGVLQRGDYRD